MNNKNKKGLIAVGIITVIGVITYFITKPKKANIKDIDKKTSLELANELAIAGAIELSSVEIVSKLDVEFLIEWAKSLSNAYYTFEYKGSKYWKKGGKKVK